MSRSSYTIGPLGDRITCGICGLTSHHPDDVKWRYCGNCHRFHTDPDEVYIYTIYDSPADYPGEFVVRRFRVDGNQEVRPDEFAVRRPTLAEARAVVPPWTSRIDRHWSDEPQIVESWV